jgi:hypothetical protein
MSSDERIADKEEERLLLIATVEDLIRREIAFKEQADGGAHLVFPSQLTRDIPADQSRGRVRGKHWDWPMAGRRDSGISAPVRES